MTAEKIWETESELGTGNTPDWQYFTIGVRQEGN